MIHTAGPIWRDGRQGEPEALARCYRSCLDLAAEKAIRSVAFPAISTGIFGFPAYLAMLPDVGAGVAVLVNGSMWTPYYPHQEIAAWAFGRLLGLERDDWHDVAMVSTEAILGQVDAALTGRDASRIPDTTPTLPLDQYAGTYGSEAAGTFEITQSPQGLRINFPGAGAFSGTLTHWHYDVFRLDYDGGDGQAWSSTLARAAYSTWALCS